MEYIREASHHRKPGIIIKNNILLIKSCTEQRGKAAKKNKGD